MSTSSSNPALQRILDRPKHRQTFEVLTKQLSGADLTTLLLAVFADRSGQVSPADLMRQFDQDRFVAAAPVDGLTLARVEHAALEAAAPIFAPIALAAMAPFGAHHALGATPQNNVVTTGRLSEVTADPTNSLALEAAARRADLLDANPKSRAPVHLCAAHRVTRAQQFSGPRSFAHFSLLGLVSAGRDQGNHRFELESMASQINVLIELVRSMTSAAIEVRVTPFLDEALPMCESLCADLLARGVDCMLWPERTHGRGYYRTMCFKLNVQVGDETFELGDGGDVWWTQELLQNRKERLVIGGLGLERIALLLAERSPD